MVMRNSASWWLSWLSVKAAALWKMDWWVYTSATATTTITTVTTVKTSVYNLALAAAAVQKDSVHNMMSYKVSKLVYFVIC